METNARIELKDLTLQTQIDTYGSEAIIPRRHLLHLTLWINPKFVLITEDVMENVFDYAPLITEILRLAGDIHYETKERLMTRIVQDCYTYSEIESMEISLRKLPVSAESVSLGVRLSLDNAALNRVRTN